ncbi:MAG: hypothetical protein ACXQS8_08975 [Candidatus Helarchaeales archaeon]
MSKISQLLGKVHYVFTNEIIRIHITIMQIYGRSSVYLMRDRVEEIVRTYIETDGDIYKKAAVLIREIIAGKPRPFIDGHKRTAWISTVRFLSKNGYYFSDYQKLKDKRYVEDEIVNGFLVPIQRKEIQKIGEIREWLASKFQRA